MKHDVTFSDIPLYKIQISSNVSTENIGKTVGIECKAYSHPLSTILWTINGTVVSPPILTKNTTLFINGITIDILAIDTNSESIAKSVMRIKQLSSASNGKYQCIANDTVNNKVLTSSSVIISTSKFANSKPKLSMY